MIYFSHIPKTAGTTLRYILSQYFEDTKIFRAQLWNDLPDPGRIEWNSYDLVTGHFGHALVDYLPTEVKTITLLRNPIERTISQYHHVISDEHYVHRVGNRVIKDIGNGEISGMLEDKECREYFSNIQAKFITLSCQPSTNKGVSFGEWEEVRTVSQSHNTVELAKSRLKDYYHVGVQEFFEQSYLLLCYKANFHPYYDGERRMVFSARPVIESFSVELIDELEKINNVDIQLYNYAIDLFKKEYDSMLDSLSSSLSLPRPGFEDVQSTKNLIVANQSKHRQR